MNILSLFYTNVDVRLRRHSLLTNFINKHSSMKIYDPKLKTVTTHSLFLDEKCNKSDAWCYLNDCDHDVFY